MASTIIAAEKSITVDHTESTDSSSEHLDKVAPEALGSSLPKHYYRSPQFIATFLSVAIAYQAAFLGYVMVANVLTIINNDIGPSTDIVWVLLVFVLLQTITFTLCGRFSDIFGRRWFFIGANTLAFIGYMISSRAQNVNTIITGMAIAGIGTGVQQSMAVLIGELVPNHHRNMALGFVFAFLSPLAAIGPGLARIMVENASWRWVFYLVAMFSGIAGLLQLFFYFPPNFHQLHSSLSKRKALMRLDYGGVAIFAGSATSLILGISWGGQKYPWKSTEVITTIVLGGVGLIGTICSLEEPLMPLYLFRNRNYVALMIVASVGSMIFYALSIVYPQQIAAVYGKSVQTTGWMSCSLVAGALFGQLIAAGSKMYHRFISIKWQLVICCVLFTAFTGGMAAITTQHEARAIVFSILSSAMIGYMEVITLAGAPMMVEPGDIGLANGVEYTIRSGFSVVASSLFVTILQNRIASNFAKYLVPTVLKADLPESSIAPFLTALSSGSIAALEQVPGVGPEVLKAAAPATLRSYTNAFQLIYLVSIAFGGCSIVAALLVSDSKLAERMTPEIARKLQNVYESPIRPAREDQQETEKEESPV